MSDIPSPSLSPYPPTVWIDNLWARLSHSAKRPGWWDLIIFIAGNPEIKYTYTGKISGKSTIEALYWLLYYMDDSGKGVHYGNSHPCLSNVFEHTIALFCYKHSAAIYALLKQAEAMMVEAEKAITP